MVEDAEMPGVVAKYSQVVAVVVMEVVKVLKVVITILAESFQQYEVKIGLMWRFSLSWFPGHERVGQIYVPDAIFYSLIWGRMFASIDADGLPIFFQLHLHCLICYLYTRPKNADSDVSSF